MNTAILEQLERAGFVLGNNALYSVDGYRVCSLGALAELAGRHRSKYRVTAAIANLYQFKITAEAVREME